MNPWDDPTKSTPVATASTAAVMPWDDPSKSTPLTTPPGGFDPHAGSLVPGPDSEPSIGQKMAHPVVNGLANLAGLLGTVGKAVKPVVGPILDPFGTGDFYSYPKEKNLAGLINPPADPEGDPSTIAPGIKKFFSDKGITPPLDYKPTVGLPRIADTAAEYASGAVPAALMTGGASAILPALGGGAASGAAGGVVRSVMNEGDTAEPYVEMATSLLAPGTISNLARGRGLQIPFTGGGTHPITGEPQVKSILNRDQVGTLGSFLKGIVTGKGVAGAKEAAGETVATRAAAQKLKENAAEGSNGIQGAIDNLSQPSDLAVGGYKPTTATQSNNEGLLRLQTGTHGAPMDIRRNENAQAISQGAVDAMSPVGHFPASSPETAQRFFASEGNKKISAVEADAAATEAKANAAKAELDAAKASITSGADSSNAATASRAVHADVKSGKAQSNQINKSLYDQVDPEAPITTTNTRAALDEIKKRSNSLLEMHPTISKIDEALSGAGLLESGKMGTATVEGGPIPTRFKVLQDADAAISDALKNPRHLPTDSEAHWLNELRTGIRKDFQDAGASNDPLAAANARYATEHAPLYKSGVTPTVTKEGADPALAMESYFGSPAGAKQLKLLSTKGSVKESDIRNYVVAKLAASGANPTRATVAAFINKNGEQLDNFPALKAELQRTRASLVKREDASDALLNEVKAKQGLLKETRQSVPASPTGKFAASGGAPEAEVATNLFGPDAHSWMKGMIAEASKDKTGAALEGLKNSVKTAMLNRVQNTGRLLAAPEGSVAASDLPTSLSQIVKMGRKGSQTRNALDLIHTPEEMKNFDRVAAQIEAEGRRIGPVGQPNTAEKTVATQATHLPAQGGGNVARTIQFLRNTVGITKDTKIKTEQILMEALLDPAKARALLMAPTAANVAKAKLLFGPAVAAAAAEQANQ